MALGKRLINTGAAAAACFTDDVNPFTGTSADGGVALYSLDYDASEASGTYDGTPTNIEFGVGGQINYGARFNGSSSRIENIDTAPLSTATSFSVSVWIKTTSTNRQFIYGDSKYTSATILGVENNTIEFRSETSAFNTSTLTISDDNWHHIVMTVVSGGNMNIYFDGNLVDTETAGTFVAGSGYQTIGVYRSSTPSYIDYFNGDIDQVRVFSKALNQTEIDTLYAETACVYDSTTDIVNYPTGTTPVAYYKLDNSSEDFSTGGNDGTDTNIEYRFGRFGQAAVFDGADGTEIITTINNSVLPVNSSFSISAWFRYDSVSGSTSPLGMMDTSGFNGWAFFASANQFQVAWDGAAPGFTTGSAHTIQLSTWFHAVFTYDGSGTSKVYINGSLQGTKTGTTISTPASTTFLRMGDGDVWNTHNGAIDQVRIYSTALDSDQVTELYNEKQDYITKDASDPFGDSNSVALYEMENNANDSSGNGNNGAQSNVSFTSTDPIRGTYEASFNGIESSSRSKITTSGLTTYNNFSISFWLNPDDVNNTRLIMGTSEGFLTQTGFGVFFGLTGNGNLTWRVSNGTSVVDIEKSSISTGNWHHIVITQNTSNNEKKLYVNGNLETTSTSTINATGQGYSLIIGGYNTYTNTPYDGDIDQVRIFDTALEGDQIFKLYAEGVRGTGL